MALKGEVRHVQGISLLETMKNGSGYGACFRKPLKTIDFEKLETIITSFYNCPVL